MRAPSNPFASLEPALRALAESMDVLPATGQAQEYLQQFDIDEVYDRIRMADERLVSRVMERPNNDLYVPLTPLPREQDHVFRFFLDGAVRTFFLGTLVLQENSTPLVLAQVGAAVVRREHDGTMARHDFGPDLRTQMIFLLDGSVVPQGTWDALTEHLAEAAGPLRLSAVDISKNDEYNDSPQLTTKEPRSRARHRANWSMRELERAVLRKLLDTTPEDEGWVVIDGGLGKEFRVGTYRTGFLGVVKNFSKDPVFQIGSGPRRRHLNTFQLLAELPVNHRTLAFSADGGRAVFWYVRIREQGALDYPLMGVIKVELPNPHEDVQESALINRLSAALLAERTVTPHGLDARWHAHLYPISVAERVIREGFYSEEVLRAGIKWPKLQQAVTQ